ncbi:MAG: hypothetical protein QGI83_17920 [Candidatus Latescibacteria bacterium]|jgi:hypothetical protein|nr:hypothetical protein [Candidatus Latescibacterota bacterium]
MKTSRRTNLVHCGEYVAEVEVDLIEEDGGWSPYLKVEDAERLDEVKQALEVGDLKRASSLGRVYRLTPVDA